MGTLKSVEMCLVLGIYVFDRFKFRYIQFDASDIEIPSGIVVSNSLEEKKFRCA